MDQERLGKRGFGVRMSGVRSWCAFGGINLVPDVHQIGIIKVYFWY